MSFLRFLIWLMIIYVWSQSDWQPLSAEKVSLSLSHLYPKIIGPKVGLICYSYTKTAI